MTWKLRGVLCKVRWDVGHLEVESGWRGRTGEPTEEAASRPVST